MYHRKRITLVEEPSRSPPDACKGRGTGWSIAHRFQAEQHVDIDDGWGSLDQRAEEEVLPPTTQVIEENVTTVLSANESP